LLEADKRRKANKLPPLDIPYIVTDEDYVTAKRSGRRLNLHIQHIDPITLGQEIQGAMFNEGLTEAEVAHDVGLSVKEVQEHLSLLDLPSKVQALVKAGKLTVKAALALTHEDAKRVEAVAERLVAAAEKVGRVGAAAAKQISSGTERGVTRMSPKGVQAMIEEIKGTVFTGMKVKAAADGAVLALEAYLDNRKAAKLISKLQEV
jgi:ParB-like chromosome segregation protein Spo0J